MIKLRKMMLLPMIVIVLVVVVDGGSLGKTKGPVLRGLTSRNYQKRSVLNMLKRNEIGLQQNKHVSKIEDDEDVYMFVGECTITKKQTNLILKAFGGILRQDIFLNDDGETAEKNVLYRDLKDKDIKKRYQEINQHEIRRSLLVHNEKSLMALIKRAGRRNQPDKEDTSGTQNNDIEKSAGKTPERIGYTRH
ncbi:uncharacterized protein [Antedon mediterranea]|uniref:uncharacterized protein n=1 Tax=Antedon mediterranea TaxID=105859 RepID=UPI003AF45D09